MSAKNKKKYDNTSALRSQRLTESMRKAGGVAFVVRLYTRIEMERLQFLVDSGFGKNRNDVLRRLITEKHAQQTAMPLPVTALAGADAVVPSKGSLQSDSG